MAKSHKVLGWLSLSYLIGLAFLAIFTLARLAQAGQEIDGDLWVTDELHIGNTPEPSSEPDSIVVKLPEGKLGRWVFPTETDPTVPSHVKGIESGDILNWDTAYSWGNHADEGYLTTETDPVFIASPAYGIEGSDISDWDNKEDSFSKNSAFNKNFGSTSGTVAEGNDSRINNGQTAFTWGNFRDYGLGTLSPSDEIDFSDSSTIGIHAGFYRVAGTGREGVLVGGCEFDNRPIAFGVVRQDGPHPESVYVNHAWGDNWMGKTELWHEGNFDPDSKEPKITGLSSSHIPYWDGSKLINSPMRTGGANVTVDGDVVLDGNHEFTIKRHSSVWPSLRSGNAGDMLINWGNGRDTRIFNGGNDAIAHLHGDTKYSRFFGNVGILTDPASSVALTVGGDALVESDDNTYIGVNTTGTNSLSGLRLQHQDENEWIIANRPVDSDRLYISASPSNSFGSSVANAAAIHVDQDKKTKFYGNVSVDGSLTVGGSSLDDLYLKRSGDYLDEADFGVRDGKIYNVGGYFQYGVNDYDQTALWVKAGGTGYNPNIWRVDKTLSGSSDTIDEFGYRLEYEGAMHPNTDSENRLILWADNGTGPERRSYEAFQNGVMRFPQGIAVNKGDDVPGTFTQHVISQIVHLSGTFASNSLGDAIALDSGNSYHVMSARVRDQYYDRWHSLGPNLWVEISPAGNTMYVKSREETHYDLNFQGSDWDVWLMKN